MMLTLLAALFVALVGFALGVLSRREHVRRMRREVESERALQHIVVQQAWLRGFDAGLEEERFWGRTRIGVN